jgi:hypothetical protein
MHDRDESAQPVAAAGDGVEDDENRCCGGRIEPQPLDRDRAAIRHDQSFVQVPGKRRRPFAANDGEQILHVRIPHERGRAEAVAQRRAMREDGVVPVAVATGMAGDGGHARAFLV